MQYELLRQLYDITLLLAGVKGTTSWEDQILAVQRDAAEKLRAILANLEAIFLKTAETSGAAGILAAQSPAKQERTAAAVESLRDVNLKSPVHMHVDNFYDAPRQRGGFVPVMLAAGGLVPQMASMNRAMTGPLPAHHYAGGGVVHDRPKEVARRMASVDATYASLHVPRYAQGGMVPVMLEPGERVYEPPMSMAQKGALMSMNDAFPRFGSGGWTVPGHGSGDTVPAWVPPGSFVLNRNASGTTGYQDGGAVPGGGKTEIHHHYDNRMTFSNNHFRSKEDAYEILKILRDHARDIYRGDTR